MKKFTEDQLRVFANVTAALGKKIDLKAHAAIIPTSDEIAQMGEAGAAAWLAKAVRYREMTKDQRAVVDATRTRLLKEQVYTLQLDGPPSGPQIKKIGKAVAAENLYWSSIYWDKVLCN